ncbi:hypothetical protein L596_001112 [Steinernema carpocapsae]|nr:hypothetical protein L596_001112 [Steinernema carpocapsae]
MKLEIGLQVQHVCVSLLYSRLSLQSSTRGLKEWTASQGSILLWHGCPYLASLSCHNSGSCLLRCNNTVLLGNRSWAHCRCSTECFCGTCAKSGRPKRDSRRAFLAARLSSTFATSCPPLILPGTESIETANPNGHVKQ